MSGRADEFFTLTGAAKHLGVSPRTVRRWIHDGKLQATLQPGPYGQQYVVPTTQVMSVQVTRDLDRVERQANLASVARVLDDHLAKREEDVLTQLRAIAAMVARQEESLARLEAELRSVREELRVALRPERRQ